MYNLYSLYTHNYIHIYIHAFHNCIEFMLTSQGCCNIMMVYNYIYIIIYMYML